MALAFGQGAPPRFLTVGAPCPRTEPIPPGATAVGSSAHAEPHRDNNSSTAGLDVGLPQRGSTSKVY